MKFYYSVENFSIEGIHNEGDKTLWVTDIVMNYELIISECAESFFRTKCADKEKWPLMFDLYDSNKKHIDRFFVELRFKPYFEVETQDNIEKDIFEVIKHMSKSIKKVKHSIKEGLK